MLIFGWLGLIGGAFSAIIAAIARSDTYNRYGSYANYTHASEIESAETVIVVGIILAAFGLFVLLAYYLRNGNRPTNQLYLLNTKKCTKCGYIANISDGFCNKCGNKLS